MIQPSHLAGRVHDGGDGQIQDAAHRPHEVDDSVALAAQGLGGNVGHEGHRWRAVYPHGYQQQAQYHDEGDQLERGGLGGVAVIQERQDVHEDDCEGGTHKNVRGALAQFAVGPVGQPAEQGQQEQGQNVVRGHDGPGQGLIEVEGASKDQVHNAVVHLPEGGDGQEGQSYEDGALAVELHLSPSLCCVMSGPPAPPPPGRPAGRQCRRIPR